MTGSDRESMLPLILLIGTIAVLLGDFLAASAARRFGISYGWYVPLSWALYLVIGAVTARELSLVHAALAGALIGFVDGTAGSLIAYRIGVMQWERPRTRVTLLAGGLAIALMCAVLTSVGGAWAVGLLTNRAA
jgi:hypothetical protein